MLSAEKKTVPKTAEKRPVPNSTGIPTAMKRRFETASGLSLDDVRIHYHSEKPGRIGALAYTQGTQVHIAPGQERHLPHELGHVVQQKQGLVRPTIRLGGMPANLNPALERSAQQSVFPTALRPSVSPPVIQCMMEEELEDDQDIEWLPVVKRSRLRSKLYGDFDSNEYARFKQANWGQGCQANFCARVTEEQTNKFSNKNPRWKFSIDHKESVAHHFTHKGHTMDHQKRVDWYRDPSNWVAMHISCNSSKSGGGDTYQREHVTIAAQLDPSLNQFLVGFPIPQTPPLERRSNPPQTIRYTPTPASPFPASGVVSPEMSAFVTPSVSPSLLQSPQLSPTQGVFSPTLFQLPPVPFQLPDPRAIRRQNIAQNDAQLSQLVAQYGENNWAAIAAEMSPFTARQCRERWKCHLSPYAEASTFMPEEDQLILDMTNKIGLKWDIIARHFPPRTPAAVKNRWMQLHLQEKRPFPPIQTLTEPTDGLDIQFPILNPNIPSLLNWPANS